MEESKTSLGGYWESLAYWNPISCGNQELSYGSPYSANEEDIFEKQWKDRNHRFSNQLDQFSELAEEGVYDDANISISCLLS